MKFVAVLLALVAVAAALLYPSSWTKQRQAFPALAAPAGQGAGAAQPDGSKPSACPAPLYQRVRNISSLDFYELRVDGIDFGPLPAGAETEYRQLTDCAARAASITLTSSQGATATIPYDLIGEAPTEAGYYTLALSLAPNNSVTSQLTKDEAPNSAPAPAGLLATRLLRDPDAGGPERDR
jgi:hypothetical protein